MDIESQLVISVTDVFDIFLIDFLLSLEWLKNIKAPANKIMNNNIFFI